MTYTFWHAGKLMGDADLLRNPSHPAHRAGILAPTPYGQSLLPRLTRFLTVTLATKRLLKSQNASIDDLRPHELNARLASDRMSKAHLQDSRDVIKKMLGGNTGGVTADEDEGNNNFDRRWR